MPDLRPTPLLFLDIDGTVREGKDDPLGRFVNGPDDVRVFPAAVHQMARWRDAGGRIVGVTNQGGIALGIVPANLVKAAIDETDRQTNYLFDHIQICPHHPDASDPAVARCWCRKPRPGLAIAAADRLALTHPQEFYPAHLALMVGDRDEDKACAEALDVDFQWARDWRNQL